MVSIIIPCFNIQDYIGRTIDSVVAQSDSNWEIIAVDDGSTDSTLKVLSGIAQEESRIHIIQRQNGGVSAARNTGLQHAKGEWIYFLDGDDIVDKDLVKSIHEVPTETDIVVFNFRKENAGNIERSYKISNPDTLFIDYLTNRQSIHICSIVTKISFIKRFNVRFDENTSYGEDREFVASLFSFHPKYHCLNKCLFRYQFREGSAVTNNRYSMRRFSSILACERTYRLLNGRREERKALAVLAFTIARHLKMYDSSNCKDEELKNLLNKYSDKYLKGFHYYGIGHIEFFATIAGIMTLNKSVFKLFLRLT